MSKYFKGLYHGGGGYKWGIQCHSDMTGEEVEIHITSHLLLSLGHSIPDGRTLKF